MARRVRKCGKQTLSTGQTVAARIEQVVFLRWCRWCQRQFKYDDQASIFVINSYPFDTLRIITLVILTWLRVWAINSWETYTVSLFIPAPGFAGVAAWL